MQPQNVKEYQAIRGELGLVRSCMTSYVSFVVLGSAPALGLLASRVSAGNSYLAMGLAAVMLAVVATLVLFLLSYKFTSHNRYAGYSKLIAQERFGPNANLDEDIFLWEVSLDRLRASDCEPKALENLLTFCDRNLNRVGNVPSLRALIEKIAGPSPEFDRFAWLRGWGLLFFLSGDRRGSWKLPLYIARIFGTLVSAFVVFSVIFFVRSIKGGHLHAEHIFLGAFFPILIVMWMVFVVRLYRQMRGSETVEAFCRKFVPIRLRVLLEYDNTLAYELIGVSGP